MRVHRAVMEPDVYPGLLANVNRVAIPIQEALKVRQNVGVEAVG